MTSFIHLTWHRSSSHIKETIITKICHCCCKEAASSKAGGALGLSLIRGWGAQGFEPVALKNLFRQMNSVCSNQLVFLELIDEVRRSSKLKNASLSLLFVLI